MKILHKINLIKHYIAAAKIKRLNARNEEFIKHSYNIEANLCNAEAWERSKINDLRVCDNFESSWGVKL
jgi:hypothetical protein